MHRFSEFWHMRLPHRLQGQKVKSQSHGAGAYCGGHLASQLVKAQKVSHFEIKVTENVLHLRVMFLAASSRISFYF